MSTELLCIGLTTLDVTARTVEGLPPGESVTFIEQIVIAPAGTAGGTALIAARLGVRTALAARIGADANGRSVRMLLESEGVDTGLVEVDPGLPTSTTLICVDRDGVRPRLHAPGASQLMQLDAQTRAAACTARFVHYAGVGGTHLDGGPGAQLLAQARAAGVCVTCDLIGPRPGAREELGRLLPSVDYFMPNAAEAMTLSQTDSPLAAARHFLALGARGCIIKDGPNGSWLVDAQSSMRIPAHRIVPVDTTSCGDSYCAGFIAGLSSGWSAPQACRLGTATAARVALAAGTLGALTDRAATEEFMRNWPVREHA